MKEICPIRSSDYYTVISNLDHWWGGRNMTPMLPRLFFNHFSDTSFIITENNNTLGFIVGFLSQTNSEKAYVHFIGVNPEYRTKGIGKELYALFFNVVSERGIKEIECVTSPENQLSIGFHTKIGFVPQEGNAVNPGGVPYTTDYDGPGEHRVIFKLKL